MNRCPITYELCGSALYSEKGLKHLSRNLKTLLKFPYTAKEQIELATHLATKISIQGVQPKLSVRLDTPRGVFCPVEKGGTYILKPPHQIYEELPQNEDLTMKLADVVEIETAFHGLIFNVDDSLTYFIKRFDRISRNHKVSVEDFSQLLGYERDTKYESSMEKLIPLIHEHCTFPLLEKAKLFRRILFSFLVGNEDMHLKNFSLIRRKNMVELSPAYDLINSSIVLKSPQEIALPLRGKKSKLSRADLIDYFGIERLMLPTVIMDQELSVFSNAFPSWEALITNSFLSQKLQGRYLALLKERKNRLAL